MKLRLLFAWYDLWVGAYWDRKERKLYILPIPCVGVVLEFKSGDSSRRAYSPDSSPRLPHED